MNLYSFVLSLHVIAAILGLGPLAAAAALTHAGSALQSSALRRLMSLVMVSLAMMLLSGVALVAFTRGALGETGWVRLSVLLLLLLGFLHSRVRRILKKAGPVPDAAGMRRINQIVWAMCLCVAAITYLMEAKPF